MAEKDDPPPYSPPLAEIENGAAVYYKPETIKDSQNGKVLESNPESPEIELLQSEIIRLPSCPDGEAVVVEEIPIDDKDKKKLYKPVSHDSLEDPPTDYLCGAILVTFFCCFATGAIAIIFAIKAELASQKEKNMRKAHQYTRIASIFVKLSVCLGVLSGIIVLFVTLATQGVI